MLILAMGAIAVTFTGRTVRCNEKQQGLPVLQQDDNAEGTMEGCGRFLDVAVTQVQRVLDEKCGAFAVSSASQQTG